MPATRLACGAVCELVQVRAKHALAEQCEGDGGGVRVLMHLEGSVELKTCLAYCHVKGMRQAALCRWIQQKR